MSSYNRLRIVLANGAAYEGWHLATIPKNSTPTPAELLRFFNTAKGQPSWDHEVEASPFDRYLLQQDDGQIVVTISDGADIKVLA